MSYTLQVSKGDLLVWVYSPDRSILESLKSRLGYYKGTSLSISKTENCPLRYFNVMFAMVPLMVPSLINGSDHLTMLDERVTQVIERALVEV